MIELSLLHHFVAVGRTRSFTQAAEQVHVCRSVVTRSIKRLEDRIGTKLFDRTTRSVTLTPAGEALFADVEEITDRIAVAAGKARRLGQGASAILKVGMCASAHSTLTPVSQAIVTFRKIFPDVDLQIITMPRDVLGPALRSSQVDVGFMILNRGDCKALEWRVMATSPLKLWVPPSWDVREPSVRLDRFRDRRWVMANPKISPDLLEMELAACQMAGFTPKDCSYPVDVLAGVMMRTCEQGVVFIHEWDAPEDDPSAKLIENLPGYCSSEVVVAWAEGARCCHVDSFVDLIFGALAPGRNSYPLIPLSQLDH